jgi:hypothetical protein
MAAAVGVTGPAHPPAPRGEDAAASCLANTIADCRQQLAQLYAIVQHERQRKLQRWWVLCLLLAAANGARRPRRFVPVHSAAQACARTCACWRALLDHTCNPTRIFRVACVCLDAGKTRSPCSSACATARARAVGGLQAGACHVARARAACIPPPAPPRRPVCAAVNHSRARVCCTCAGARLRRSPAHASSSSASSGRWQRSSPTCTPTWCAAGCRAPGVGRQPATPEPRGVVRRVSARPVAVLQGAPHTHESTRWKHTPHCMHACADLARLPACRTSRRRKQRGRRRRRRGRRSTPAATPRRCSSSCRSCRTR